MQFLSSRAASRLWIMSWDDISTFLSLMLQMERRSIACYPTAPMLGHYHHVAQNGLSKVSE
jgi:hypothetical protein